MASVAVAISMPMAVMAKKAGPRLRGRSAQTQPAISMLAMPVSNCTQKPSGSRQMG
ncbi:hypothetical protein D3C87_1840100 [compost metagenome]